jgi:hypothetical protein
MNRVLLTGMIVMLTLISCSDKKTNTAETLPEPQIKTAAQVDPVAQKLEALKLAQPTDMGELQNMMPEEMAGIKRNKLSMNSNLGYGIVRADYEKNSKTQVHLVMYDCTGEEGANLYKSSYLSYLNKPDANTEGYTKTIDFLGGKVIERHESANNVTTLSFMTKDKILIVLSGKGVTLEELKEAAQTLHVKAS